MSYMSLVLKINYYRQKTVDTKKEMELLIKHYAAYKALDCGKKYRIGFSGYIKGFW